MNQRSEGPEEPGLELFSSQVASHNCAGAVHHGPYQLPAAVRTRLLSTVSHSFPSRLHFRRLSLIPPTAVTSFSTSMYMEGSELTWMEESNT